ncbi:type IV pilus assembly protein PilX [Amphritea atlantica]|uniref:Type IV pilus assembly protein PilX n=1 Tax=Amphritea atlantica TaxID=355243 RepID=A0A1H9LMA3_9GAMM|nr:PilX N-terminal domain-containing pilus assembly protein [Amphritea atlantica]SER12540.1 type IV pilus assembly protein PilX [Amphritea atlantica]
MINKRLMMPKNREQGAVLIIALIFVLILTLIGVSSMQGTTLQEKMSGNLRDRSVAFNAAEAALREGENSAYDSYDNGTLEYIGDSVSGSYGDANWTATLVRILENTTTLPAAKLGVVIRVTASSNGLSDQSDVQLESIYVVKD